VAIISMPVPSRSARPAPSRSAARSSPRVKPNSIPPGTISPSALNHAAPAASGAPSLPSGALAVCGQSSAKTASTAIQHAGASHPRCSAKRSSGCGVAGMIGGRQVGARVCLAMRAPATI